MASIPSMRVSTDDQGTFLLFLIKLRKPAQEIGGSWTGSLSATADGFRFAEWSATRPI